MKTHDLNTYYSDSDILKQIDFNLRKFGTGYCINSKILKSLMRDRNKMFSILTEIADGDGDINLGYIRSFVEKHEGLYEKGFKYQEHIESVRDRS